MCHGTVTFMTERNHSVPDYIILPFCQAAVCIHIEKIPRAKHCRVILQKFLLHATYAIDFVIQGIHETS